MEYFDRYPYFVYGMLEWLRQHPEGETAELLRERIAANVGDMNSLIALIGDKEGTLRNLFPAEGAHRLSTEDTIDSFLNKYSPTSKLSSPVIEDLKKEEKSSLPPVIPAPQQPITPSPQQPNNPSPQQPNTPTPQHPKSPANPLEEVKKLVKNKEYAEALQILEANYLNNPKKSVYFADQIRFIRKMMINDSKKQS